MPALDSAPEIAVITGGDEHVALPAAASIHTLLSTKRPEARLCLVVVDAGIRSRLEAWVCRRVSQCAGCRLVWLAPSLEELKSLPHRRGLPRTAFLRLLAIRDLPLWFDRVVWIDTDTIVRRDLSELAHCELFGHAVGAVQEYGARELGQVEGTRSTVGILGVDGTNRYFNSGVMSIDVRRWHNDRISERVLDYTAAHAESIRFADQDGLNVVLAGRWAQLDLRWNMQVAAWRCMPRLARSTLAPEVVAARESLSNEAFIVHFAGDKPWKEGLRSPFRGEYFASLRSSRFLHGPQYAAHRCVSYARAIAKAATVSVRMITRSRA